MNTTPTLQLKDGSRIVILGGGPSGSFFAIHLLSKARASGRKLKVTIIDNKMKQKPEGKGLASMRCNFCAGVISPLLQKELAKVSIKLPGSVLCQTFSHIWIHGLWKNFPLKVPAGSHLLSVFRGGLPVNKDKNIKGFDGFILEKALSMGAELVTATAVDISYSKENKPVVSLNAESSLPFNIEADFLCMAVGINAGKAGAISQPLKAFQRLNSSYIPVRTRPALIFELKPGSRYLKKYLDQELYIIVSGSKKLDIDHAALVPKRSYLTVALMGKSIDQANFPHDTDAIIKQFFTLKSVRQVLPGITPQSCPISCSCNPLMAISPARNPFNQRIGLVGDAIGARLYRDGLYSAFIISRNLAHTVLYSGVDKKSLAPAYAAARKWLYKDNLYGKMLVGLMQTTLKSPFFSRVLYQTFATEMKFKRMDQWPVGSMLWEIGSSPKEYRLVFKRLLSGSVLGSLARGIVKTLRNMAVERFFNLKWGTHGRYPAVVIKEKRDYIKFSVSKPLGIILDKKPQMERMYAVKIRASGQTIFNELGRFGEPDSSFLRLRFVDVKRIFGGANEKGAVIRYSPSFLPLFMDISLVQRIGNKALVYEPSSLFTHNGKLVFDITPTRDGNNRLVVYTAFDYKKGRTSVSRTFWFVFKHLFPDFAHDVVWNHAVCTIKAEAEQHEKVLVDEKNGLIG